MLVILGLGLRLQGVVARFPVSRLTSAVFINPHGAVWLVVRLKGNFRRDRLATKC